VAIPDRVTVVEVGPRDGLQNEDALVPTAAKVVLIEELARCGLQVVEATSFVSPQAVPQLADAEDVMRALDRREGVRYPVLVPNMRGMQRAEAAGAEAVAVFTAASEAFTAANLNMTIGDSLDAAEEVLDRAAELGWWRRGYVSTAFGCPYQGPVDEEDVVRVADALIALGCEEVSIGDTIGIAEPDDVDRVAGALLERIPAERLALHLHHTGGRALDNVEAGLELGIAVFDGSAGGAGGCPFAPGAPGNLATEELVALLDRHGIAHGVDLERLTAAGAGLRSLLGV
jgi:isopropylmalate/homocitrate/citramalate synthase